MSCRKDCPDSATAKPLAGVPYFAGLPEAVLEGIERKIRRRRYGAGEVVLMEGERGDGGLFLMLEGMVKVCKISPEGREQVLRLIGSGRSFNDVPMFDGGANPGTVMALGATTVGHLPGTAFQALMETHPEIARNATRVLAGRLRALTAMVEDLAFRGVLSRVAGLLLSCALGHHALAEGEHTACVRITQADVAAMTGSVREVVQRALKTLEADGAIRMERAQIAVLNTAILEIWAEKPSA